MKEVGVAAPFLHKARGFRAIFFMNVPDGDSRAHAREPEGKCAAKAAAAARDNHHIASLEAIALYAVHSHLDPPSGVDLAAVPGSRCYFATRLASNPMVGNTGLRRAGRLSPLCAGSAL